jgi:ribosomal protein S27E
MVSPDVDTLLIAIRAATHGGFMKVELTCPKCTAINELSADIAAILHAQPKLEPPYFVRHNDLVIFIKPYSFSAQIKAAIVAFDAAKQIQLKTNRDQAKIEEDVELKAVLSENIKRVSDVKFDLLLDSITHIVCNYNEAAQTGDIVTDKKYIREFLINVHKKIVDEIQDEVIKLNELITSHKELDVQCASCGHTWTGNIDFNPSNFFD